MKRKLRLLLAVVLAMTMFMGLSITSFAATVALQNPKTIGVQLIDDTLIIQEDHHNFFVWGKSVMIQCPGVTDILPNNVTDMMDIQFDGNLYKGIKEVIIVSSPEKNDKVHLEEGSMIITGVTTLKQIQNIKTAILSRPNTLVELKSVLTGASKYLSTTKNYIIGKHNEVLNETGSRVAKKELQGTAELVTDEDVVHAVVEEATSSDSESKPVEEKKDPTPTPTPTCSVDHSTFCSGKNCDECGEPGTKGHAWSSGTCRECRTSCSHPNYNYVSDEDHKCTVCGKEDSHVYDNDGYCSICMHNCQHTGQTVGQTCEFCNITVPCQVDHSAFCPGTECSECYQPGTGEHAWSNGKCSACNTSCSHSYEFVNVGKHKCTVCNMEASHAWNDDGQDSSHICSGCSDTQQHTYEKGICNVCGHICTHKEQTEGELCSHCSTRVPYTCEEDHSAFCQGKMCDVCEKPGTGDHAWLNGECSACSTHCDHPSYEKIDRDKHKCSDCDVIDEHNSVDVDNDVWHECSFCGNQTVHDYKDGVCKECDHHCTHSGYSSDQQCTCCWITVP